MNNYKVVLSGLFGLLLISGCASNTKLSNTWSDPGNTASYNEILIVGISDSEQKRRAYESFFIASFQGKGINAVASYTVIDHKIELNLEGEKGSLRKIVKSAIKDSDIDAVLVTHVVSIEEEDIYRPSMDYQPVYSSAYYSRPHYGGMYGYHGYVTAYVQQPGYYTEERTYVLESNLYDVKSGELVWTTRSKTFAPDSMEQAINDISSLIIADLKSRKLIR